MTRLSQLRNRHISRKHPDVSKLCLRRLGRLRQADAPEPADTPGPASGQDLSRARARQRCKNRGLSGGMSVVFFAGGLDNCYDFLQQVVPARPHVIGVPECRRASDFHARKLRAHFASLGYRAWTGPLIVVTRCITGCASLSVMTSALMRCRLIRQVLANSSPWTLRFFTSRWRGRGPVRLARVWPKRSVSRTKGRSAWGGLGLGSVTSIKRLLKSALMPGFALSPSLMTLGRLFRPDGKGVDALTLGCATGGVTFLPSVMALPRSLIIRSCILSCLWL